MHGNLTVVFFVAFWLFRLGYVEVETPMLYFRVVELLYTTSRSSLLAHQLQVDAMMVIMSRILFSTSVLT